MDGVLHVGSDPRTPSRPLPCRRVQPLDGMANAASFEKLCSPSALLRRVPARKVRNLNEFEKIHSPQFMHGWEILPFCKGTQLVRDLGDFRAIPDISASSGTLRTFSAGCPNCFDSQILGGIASRQISMLHFNHIPRADRAVTFDHTSPPILTSTLTHTKNVLRFGSLGQGGVDGGRSNRTWYPVL
jgi:hypothetical protein